MSGEMISSLAAVAFALLAGWLAYRERRHAKAARDAERENGPGKAALAVVTAGYCVMRDATAAAACSPWLCRSLGLPDDARPTPDEIFATLEPADGTRLKDAADKLRSGRIGFVETVRKRGRERVFRVEGAWSPSGGSEGCSVIWFTDVSDATQAVATARAERDDYAQLLDSLPLPVWRRGADLSLVYCNLAYARAVDRPREEVLAEGIELPDSALADVSLGLARKARDERGSHSSRLHVVVSGERRLLELTERGLAGGTVGTAVDRTAAEDLEAQLERHIQAHGEVLENLGTAIAIWGPDMRLKFFNSAYAQLWRVDESTLAEEPHHNDVMEMLRESRRLPEQSDFPAYKAERLKLFSTLIEPMEELMHLPDGSTLRVMGTPHPFGGVLLTYEDVTDRLALERSYNTLIAVQRETLNNLYEGVAVYGVDGRLKLHNPAFARIWKLPKALLETEPHAREVTARTRSFFDVSDDDWPEFIEQSVTQITEPGSHDGRQERADGSVVDWAQVPLPDGASLFTFLDVTDSIRVERALRERNEALETTDRLKSEFLANISYELRTPLNAIVGFAEILENKFFGELNERQLEYSRAIVESSQRLLALINDILDLATIEAGYLRLDLAPVKLDAVLEAIQTLGHERARNRGIELAIKCPDNIAPILADERRLKQALYNLLSNSLKFTPEGGKIVVGARRDGEEMLITVADTGIGIPLEQQTHVFDKFERGMGLGRQAGAGLGLSLVKSLIELHDGWVELDSAPNSGTKVTCHLPLRPAIQPSENAAE